MNKVLNVLNFPPGKCSAGHICYGRAVIKEPVLVQGERETGKLCEPGYYCVEGTTREVPCPKGTYRLDDKF